jgi:hypothetical protein
VPDQQSLRLAVAAQPVLDEAGRSLPAAGEVVAGADGKPAGRSRPRSGSSDEHAD